MNDPRADDLFESSKMTFGEHLEELRSALIKSLTVIAIGFVGGLFAAPWVVPWLQAPLVAALEEYYEAEAVDRLVVLLRERQEAGEPLPADLAELGELDDDEARERIAALLTRRRLLPEAVYLQPTDVLAELRARYPGLPDELPLPAAGAAPEEGAPSPGAPVEGAPGDAAEVAADGGAGVAAETGGNDDGGLLRIFLWRPLDEDLRMKVKALNAQEAFFIYIKAALVTGAILASPWVFYFVWQFVAAGLYPHERQYVHIFLPFSVGLFLAGAGMAFLFVFKYVLRFLFQFNALLGITPDPRISEWLSFVLLLPLGFGISFQLPLVMLFLERIGVFDVGTYLQKWRIAVLVVAVLSMLLTPADPQSMLLMAVPLTVLYFVGIGLCKYMPRRRGPFSDPID